MTSLSFSCHPQCLLPSNLVLATENLRDKIVKTQLRYLKFNPKDKTLN